MAFQIVQRVAGNQLKAAPYLQLSVRTAASKSVIFVVDFQIISMRNTFSGCGHKILYNSDLR